MKRFILTAASILCLATTPAFAACTLVWDEPTFEDGSPTAPGDIHAYRVYVANKSSDISTGATMDILAVDSTTNPVTHITCAEVGMLTPGKQVAVTAVNPFGVESDFSNILTNVKLGKPEKNRTEDR